MHKQYDYIIAGTGCAGLSLAVMLKQSKLSFNKVLLIDKDLKNKNDRTWCFWTNKSSNWFDDIVFRKWNDIYFKDKSFEKKINIGTYNYMMIKGIDFYNYCLNELKNDARFEFVTDTIYSLSSENGLGKLNTATNNYYSKYIFNSAIQTLQKKQNHINYVQHFKGWTITTPENAFDITCPTFMDFRVNQYNDCRFFYVIPFTKNTALIEYTGFSKNRLPTDEYDNELRSYINNTLNVKNYIIDDSEFGEIPMVESSFVNPFGSNIINIGTSGGFSKPSTGYTFYFIQKNIQKIILKLEKGISIKSNSPRKKRFQNYDKVFMEVMDAKKIESREIFATLFKKNSAEELLNFLNEESNLLEELKIMNSVPKKHFITAFMKKMIFGK
ncbi:MAG: lycopene cyclase [Burkholderiales bacterium]|nr:lycopene cyclase [Bacteroidia bacterium]